MSAMCCGSLAQRCRRTGPYSVYRTCFYAANFSSGIWSVFMIFDVSLLQKQNSHGTYVKQSDCLREHQLMQETHASDVEQRN